MQQGMRSLHTKFFLIVAALVLAVSALALIVQTRNVRYYMLCMTQALNELLAQRLVTEYLQPLPEGPATATVESAFRHIMAVNPSIELYLLDRDGRIVAFTAPRDEVLRRQIDLRPVEAFVVHRFVFPLFGDDPRSISGTKIFSAALLDPTRPERGYLYVILGGHDYDASANRLKSGLLLRSALTVIGTGIAVALAAAFIVLMTMTRRLRRLAGAIEDFRHSQFRNPVMVPVREAEDGDELDRLARAFNAMAAHIQEQIEETAQSNALRRNLIAGVSHDLRTPLASLRGYLETLIMKAATLSPDDRLMYLQIASAQSDRLNRLVEELFELAKLDDIEARIEFEPFQLSELVQDVVQKFSLVAQDKHIELTGQYMPEAPLIAGNLPLVERLLDNLLENAIRHTPAGGRVDVSVTSDGAKLKLEVSDTGSGIPEQDIPLIFERFYRVDSARSATSGGAGLGLAITKRIVELHGGRILVRSQIGLGSSFVVEFPIEQGEQQRSSRSNEPQAVSRI